MKKSLLVFAVLLGTALTVNAQIYLGKKTDVSFFSYTPLENISAKDTVATMILNSKTGDVIAKISIKGFVFPNALMQEHFNENYMESDKYPFGLFKGKINETVDYTKDGTHNVTITGALTIHGVAKTRTIPATITVKGGMVTVDTKFSVALADHNITVPTAVGAKIAENIDVTVHSEMADSSKK
jgi:polyisoprenoid-binding protein YceI